LLTGLKYISNIIIYAHISYMFRVVADTFFS
jgi:hypothetical protein